MKRGGFIRKVGKTNARTAFQKIKPKTVSYWKKEAWKVFSRWIRERDNYTCITCGKQGKGSFMHAGHYITRKCGNTMFDERNVHAQCMNCNMWGYGNMGVYTLKMVDLYGQNIIKEITEQSKIEHKFTIPELQSIIQKYENTPRTNTL